MSKLMDLLTAVVQELDESHGPGGFTVKFEDYLPNWVVTRAGVERHFTKTAQEAVLALAAQLFADREQYRAAMRLPQFSALVRRCIADLHAERVFAQTPAEGRAQLKRLDQEIGERLKSMQVPFTHEFPATTLRIEEESPYQVGPVHIRSISTWLDSVALSERSAAAHGIVLESNWKAELITILEKSNLHDRPHAPQHVQEFVNALHGRDAVVSVTVTGLEQTYSREVARMLARTALDGVSMLAGRGRRAFSQQALSDERLQPPRAYSILVFEGEHWVGGGWTEDSIPIAQAGLRKKVVESGKLYDSLCKVVTCLLDRGSHQHPQLAMRWASALEWYAEGCRETSSSLAVTKLAAALDILTGQKAKGITQMIGHILGCAVSDPVFQGSPENLTQIVQGIYGDGRSQLLHGNQVDRLIAFESEREEAQALGALALVNLLGRLGTYQGPDTESAFLNMPP